MDITFNCKKCGQQLEIDESGAGMMIQCPKCAASVAVPSKTTALTQPEVPRPRTIELSPVALQSFLQDCPDCGRQVPTRVASCPCCGRPITPIAARGRFFCDARCRW